MPLNIGITGGIGAGKSLVARVFQNLGIPVYDSDSRAKLLMATEPSLITAISSLLGKDSYTADGTINRKYIASKVFQEQALLEQLNALVHPAIATDFADWSSRHSAMPYVLKEAALLFESGSYKTLDKIILVHASIETRIARVLERDQRSRTEIESIIANQLPEETKLSMADFIIDNNGTQLVIPQVLAIDAQLRTLAS